MIPGTETRTSALARMKYGVVHLLHVVLLNNCYAIASQRGEAAKTGRLLDDNPVSATSVLRIFASASRPCTGRSGQVSFFNLPCGQRVSGKNNSAVRRVCSSVLPVLPIGERLHHAKAKRCRQRFCSDYFQALHIVGQSCFGMRKDPFQQRREGNLKGFIESPVAPCVCAYRRFCWPSTCAFSSTALRLCRLAAGR